MRISATKRWCLLILLGILPLAIWFSSGSEPQDDTVWLERHRFFERVRQHGGEVGYFRNPRPSAKVGDWLRRNFHLVIPALLDREGAGPQRVKVLRLLGSDFTDDDMRFVGSLEWLERVELRNTRVTDDGLKHLSSLTRLREFRLVGPFTSNAFTHIATLKSLAYLQLEGTQISNVKPDRLKALSLLKGVEYRQSANNEPAAASVSAGSP